MNNDIAYSPELLKKLVLEIQRNKDELNFIERLTERELEILKLIVQEKTSQEISETLNISKQTVDTHRKHILQKTKVKSIIGLVKLAYEHGII